VAALPHHPDQILILNESIKCSRFESRTFLPLIVLINHVLKALIDEFLKVCKITANNGPVVVATETAVR